MSVTVKHADPFACAFWPQRFSLIALVTSNDGLITFLSVTLFICTSGVAGLGCQLIRLQSVNRSLHPPLLQNPACDFNRTRLLSKAPFVIGISRAVTGSFDS